MSECRQEEDAKLLARVLSEDAPGLHELLVFGENTARFVEYATQHRPPGSHGPPDAAPVPIVSVLSAYESTYESAYTPTSRTVTTGPRADPRNPRPRPSPPDSDDPSHAHSSSATLPPDLTDLCDDDSADSQWEAPPLTGPELKVCEPSQKRWTFSLPFFPQHTGSVPTCAHSL